MLKIKKAHLHITYFVIQVIVLSAVGCFMFWELVDFISGNENCLLLNSLLVVYFSLKLKYFRNSTWISVLIISIIQAPLALLFVVLYLKFSNSKATFYQSRASFSIGVSCIVDSLLYAWLAEKSKKLIVDRKEKEK
jgi:hypothetical protein